MTCPERAIVASPDAQSPFGKQNKFSDGLGIGLHWRSGNSGESTSSPGHALHFPLSTSGTASDSPWGHGSDFAFESASAPEHASASASAWESAWESVDFASGFATDSGFDPASRGNTPEQTLVNKTARLHLSSSSPKALYTQTAPSHSAHQSPIQAMPAFLRPGVSTPPQDRHIRKANINRVGTCAQRLLRIIGQTPSGRITDRPVPYVGPPEVPLMLERWFEEGLGAYGTHQYGHKNLRDTVMGEEEEQDEGPWEDIDIHGFARVKPAVGVKKTVEKTVSASWVSNTRDVHVEEKKEEGQEMRKDVDSQGFVRPMVPNVTGITQTNHYDNPPLDSLGAEMNRTSSYGQMECGYGQRLQQCTSAAPCTLPLQPPSRQQVNRQHPPQFGGFQQHTTWVPQSSLQMLGFPSQNICNGSNRGNTQGQGGYNPVFLSHQPHKQTVPSIILNDYNGLDNSMQSDNRDDLFTKLFREPPTSSCEYTVSPADGTHVIYSNDGNDSHIRARPLLPSITSIYPDRVWCHENVRKRTPPALYHRQKRARSQPPPAGLHLASIHEPYLWLVNFPGNTPGLHDTLLAWHTTLRRLYARLGPPGKRTSDLMKLHPVFPFPCAEPVCAPLVGARFFELGSEKDEPEKETWRIGMRDATIANAGLTWNCVDVFDECGVEDGRVMMGRNKLRDGVSESAYKYAVDARERARTGEGRWCFLVIKGELPTGGSKLGGKSTSFNEKGAVDGDDTESEDEDMPPFLVIAFPSTAVTKFTKSVEVLYQDEDGETPLSAGFSRSGASTPDTVIARSPCLSPYSPGGSRLEVPRAIDNVQRNFSLPEPEMAFTNTLAPAQAGGQAVFNSHIGRVPSPGISNARSVSAPFPTISAKNVRAPSNLRIDTTASYAAFGSQHQSHTTLTSTFRDLNVFHTGYLNPGYPWAANPNYYSYPISRAPTLTATSSHPFHRPVRRVVLHFQKCGDLPLIEGYKTDVCAWRDWLEAVGQGRGKLVLYEEVNNQMDETGMETGGRVVI